MGLSLLARGEAGRNTAPWRARTLQGIGRGGPGDQQEMESGKCFDSRTAGLRPDRRFAADTLA